LLCSLVSAGQLVVWYLLGIFYELFRVDALRRCHQIVISVIITPAVFPFKIPTLIARKNEEEEP
jgi:hypothetical protein